MTQESIPPGFAGILLSFLAGAAVGASVVALTTRKTGPQRLANFKLLADLTQAKVTALAQDAGTAWETTKDRTALAAEDIERGFSDAASDLRG